MVFRYFWSIPNDAPANLPPQSGPNPWTPLAVYFYILQYPQPGTYPLYRYTANDSPFASYLTTSPPSVGDGKNLGPTWQDELIGYVPLGKGVLAGSSDSTGVFRYILQNPVPDPMANYWMASLISSLTDHFGNSYVVENRQVNLEQTPPVFGAWLPNPDGTPPVKGMVAITPYHHSNV